MPENKSRCFNLQHPDRTTSLKSLIYGVDNGFLAFPFFGLVSETVKVFLEWRELVCMAFFLRVFDLKYPTAPAPTDEQIGRSIDRVNAESCFFKCFNNFPLICVNALCMVTSHLCATSR